MPICDEALNLLIAFDTLRHFLTTDCDKLKGSIIYKAYPTQAIQQYAIGVSFENAVDLHFLSASTRLQKWKHSNAG